MHELLPIQTITRDRQQFALAIARLTVELHDVRVRAALDTESAQQTADELKKAYREIEDLQRVLDRERAACNEALAAIGVLVEDIDAANVTAMRQRMLDVTAILCGPVDRE